MINNKDIDYDDHVKENASFGMVNPVMNWSVLLTLWTGEGKSALTMFRLLIRQ